MRVFQCKEDIQINVLADRYAVFCPKEISNENNSSDSKKAIVLFLNYNMKK